VVIGGAAWSHPQAYNQTSLNSIVITNQNPGSQSFSPINIDFGGSDDCPSESPWVEDTGEVYGDHGGRNYGWNTDLTGRAFLRSGSVPCEKLSLIKTLVDSTVYTWNLEVPNGLYYISLCVGDESSNNKAHRVLVEDNLFVNNINLSAQEYYEIVDEIVYVYDGNLTLKVGGGSLAGSYSATCLNYLKVTNERPASWPDPLRFGMQPGYSKFLKGYKTENGGLYTADRGFGFLDLVRLTKECASIGVSEAKNLNQVFNTFVVSRPGETYNWKVDNLGANETVYVYASVGEPRMQHTHRLDLEGDRVINDVVLAADRYYLVNGEEVNVGADGELDVSFGGISGQNTTLNYVVIDDEPFVQWPLESGKYAIRVNFQPSGIDPEPNYQIDAGDAFCPIRKCGWSPPVFTRYYNITSNKLLDSWAITRPSEKFVWDVAVPASRTYLVTAAAGHPASGTNYNQRVAVETESNYIINGKDTDGGPLIGSTTVNAASTADGFIRLYVGGDTSPTLGFTTINYVTIIEQ